MRVAVIGGTGHIGGFLTAQLVADGHEVTVITRGQKPFPRGGAWEEVSIVKADYRLGDRQWQELIRDVRADVVVDIIQADMAGTYEAIRGFAGHYVVCGSVWMLGVPTRVPAPEVSFGPAIGENYQRRFDEIQSVMAQAERDGFAVTVILPPNICGPGKIPLDLRGGRDIEAHRAHQRGEPVQLPQGCNTLIGPCDASDVAQGFRQAVRHREAAAGHIFNVGAPYALRAAEFVAAYGGIYGVEIPIEWIPHEIFYGEVLPASGANAHFRAHMCPDLSKIRARLGYEPDFTPEQTMERAVEWTRSQGLL